MPLGKLDVPSEFNVKKRLRARDGCESKGESKVWVFELSCELRALPLSLPADVCGFVFTSARGRGGRQIRQLWISDALQMKTAAAQVARRQLKLGCRQSSTKAIGRSRERSNYDFISTKGSSRSCARST